MLCSVLLIEGVKQKSVGFYINYKMYMYVLTLLTASNFPPVFALLLLLAFNALCILLILSGYSPPDEGSKTKVCCFF